MPFVKFTVDRPAAYNEPPNAVAELDASFGRTSVVIAMPADANAPPTLALLPVNSVS